MWLSDGQTDPGGAGKAGHPGWLQFFTRKTLLIHHIYLQLGKHCSGGGTARNPLNVCDSHLEGQQGQSPCFVMQTTGHGWEVRMKVAFREAGQSFLLWHRLFFFFFIISFSNNPLK